MGLSNYIPSSRVIQPGVCTSTTRPASPFNGQVIYETDTKRTLVWQGSAWVMLTDADSPPGLEYITSATATSGTSLSVNNCFTSTYQSYVLYFTGKPASSAYGIDIRLRVGGTDAITGYYWGVTAVDIAAGTSVVARGNNSNIFATYAIADTTGYCTSVVQIVNPQLAQYTGISCQSTDTRGSAAYGGINSSGQLLNTTQYDGFSLMWGGGGGTIGYLKVNVYGYRDSI